MSGLIYPLNNKEYVRLKMWKSLTVPEQAVFILCWILTTRFRAIQ